MSDQHIQRHWLLVLDLDGLLHCLQISPLALEFILCRVVRIIQPLDVEILHIWSQVGDPPGDAAVVTDDDQRHTGEGEADTVETSTM